MRPTKRMMRAYSKKPTRAEDEATRQAILQNSAFEEGRRQGIEDVLNAIRDLLK